MSLTLYGELRGQPSVQLISPPLSFRSYNQDSQVSRLSTECTRGCSDLFYSHLRIATSSVGTPCSWSCSPVLFQNSQGTSLQWAICWCGFFNDNKVNRRLTSHIWKLFIVYYHLVWGRIFSCHRTITHGIHILLSPYANICHLLSCWPFEFDYLL